ncbi:hypothetical protein BOTBODRAFT_30742 [Botryobasidium botryosum FD-172 SS1]|uniref:D-aminoacyl-tRNA deacylase n=1 Tax=Botryobasidium botryosum (strain FD-172 SS1) TaxID=930990 RepID=A0A067MYB4_BOTB1|nr:hypothetical protein BOTBODRAFT_30742 [Botryobasidium botryosum FD-172 SS1]
MRAIIQRVSSASVTVDNEVISQIGKGLMVLVGIGKDDTPADVENIAKKILSVRAFSHPETDAPWGASVTELDGEVLCVSQFTLFANTTKGSKPDFHSAMGGEASRDMYASFLTRIGELYKPEKIKDGKFGAMMSVALTNEGPVTLTLDSRKFEYITPPAGRAKVVKGVKTNSHKNAPPSSQKSTKPKGEAAEPAT